MQVLARNVVTMINRRDRLQATLDDKTKENEASPNKKLATLQEIRRKSKKKKLIERAFL